MSQDQILFENVLSTLDELERALASWNGRPNAEQASQMRVLLDSIHQISREAKSDYKGVDWRKFNALRNAFLHDYLGLSAAGIRSFLVNELPLLRRAAGSAVHSAAESNSPARIA